MEFICVLIRIDYFPSWIWCTLSLESNLHSVHSSFPDKYWTPLITRFYYLYDFFLIWMWEQRAELVSEAGTASHLRLWMRPSPPGELLNLTMFDINGFNKEETNNDTTFGYQTGSNSSHIRLWMTIMMCAHVCEGSQPPTKFCFSEAFPEGASVSVDYKCLFSVTSVSYF